MLLCRLYAEQSVHKNNKIRLNLICILCTYTCTCTCKDDNNGTKVMLVVQFYLNNSLPTYVSVSFVHVYTEFHNNCYLETLQVLPYNYN